MLIFINNKFSILDLYDLAAPGNGLPGQADILPPYHQTNLMGKQIKYSSNY